MSRSYSYVDLNTTNIFGCSIHGIFEKHENLKYKFGNRKFWARGYFVDTAGKNEKVIKEYIRNQFIEDKLADELNMKEYIDPFTGEKVKAAIYHVSFRGSM